MRSIRVKRNGSGRWEIYVDGKRVEKVTDFRMIYAHPRIIVVIESMEDGDTQMSTKYTNPHLTVEP